MLVCYINVHLLLLNIIIIIITPKTTAAVCAVSYQCRKHEAKCTCRILTTIREIAEQMWRRLRLWRGCTKPFLHFHFTHATTLRTHYTNSTVQNHFSTFTPHAMLTFRMHGSTDSTTTSTTSCRPPPQTLPTPESLPQPDLQPTSTISDTTTQPPVHTPDDHTPDTVNFPDDSPHSSPFSKYHK